MLWHTISRTLGVEYIYPYLLLFYDMISSIAVLIKLPELKLSVVILGRDCQKLPLKYLMAVLNFLILSPRLTLSR